MLPPKFKTATEGLVLDPAFPAGVLLKITAELAFVIVTPVNVLFEKLVNTVVPEPPFVGAVPTIIPLSVIAEAPLPAV